MKILLQLVIMTVLSLSFNANAQTSLISKMNEIKDHYKLPGMGLGIVQLNQKTQVFTAGVREAGKSQLIKPSDRFHLGSQVKSMTAYLISQLVKEKKI